MQNKMHLLHLKLWQYFKTEILKQSLTDVFNLEMNLLPVLLDMRAVGVRVDLDGAESLKKEFLEKNKIYY
jgi:DNA polymerase I-like protein with 3'-5' exonuclease and polymerase domains